MPTGNGNVEKLALTVLHVDWSHFKLDTTLDAFLHRALIRHGELKNMTWDFFNLAESTSVEVAGMFYYS